MVIVGHSTGCQDAVRYAQRHRSSSAAAPLRGVVLQAPVSDVEWLATQAGTEERVAAARRMAAEGRGEEVAFRAFDIDGAAVTARRWLSLAAPGGDDDMFSSSLSDAQLAAVLGPLRGLPALVLLSGEEEYLPPGLDYLAVGRRLVQVCLRLAALFGQGLCDAPCLGVRHADLDPFPPCRLSGPAGAWRLCKGPRMRWTARRRRARR